MFWFIKGRMSTFTHENLFDEIEHDAVWFPFGDKKIGVAQIEIVHADQFLEEFGKDTPGVLKRLGEQNQLDTGLLSIIDIDNARDIFICEDEWLRDVLSKATGVSWTRSRAITSGIMMRKELVPLLREVLS